MQCICKKDKINQEERILESKCKTAITELEQLKDNTKKQKRKNKDIDRTYISTEEVNGQIKMLSEQTKTKVKNLYQEKKTLKEVIKELGKMTKTKIDSVPEKELQIKQLQINL